MVKLHLQAFWQNFEYVKMQKFGFCLPEVFFSKTTEKNSWILHTNSPWVCLIISGIKAKNILNIVNLMQNL